MMTIEVDGETFMSTNEACRAICVSRETLNRYVNSGLIRRYKKGIARNAYYKLSDVNELVRKRSEMQEDAIE